jgi:SAM-dependent methyltransferase
MYWLKPFDAVNDAANAWSLRRFLWKEPILEVGGGDGVFSFIMHEGKFAFADDRYDQADPGRPGDIFDVYRPGQRLTVRRRAGIVYEAGVDLKWSHILKCHETGLYRRLAVASPERLPFAAGSFNTVFLYFPHGLAEYGGAMSYESTLAEVRRVLRPGGTLLMTAVNRDIRRHFVCYPLHRFFATRGWRRASEYFRRLDAGRYAEVSGLGRTPAEWETLLDAHGFRPEEAWTQVRPFAWRIYDVQTRPVLRTLIRVHRVLRPIHLRAAIKAVTMVLSLPLLALLYLVWARPRPWSSASGADAALFFAFRAVAVTRGAAT